MSLNWNEIRIRAKAFADEFADATYEKGETHTFYNEFFKIFGIKRRQVARYEEHIKKLNNKAGFIDLFWPKVLLVEQKSAGRSLEKAAEQAGEYFDAIKDRDKPRFQLLCDFQTFELLDRGERESWSFTLAELPEKIDLFAFMLGREKRKYHDQDPVNIEASELMGKVHDDLEESGYTGHNLEQYLVRLLFMLFADDTGIFEPRDHLLDVIENRTHEDGSDLGMWLSRIFEVLNTPETSRSKNLDEDLNRFPYVNGELFAESLPMADFTSKMRENFLEACRFNWQGVSPAIFGSLFQSVMNPVERRKKGAHYTSEKNIMKLIGPLFLDDLRQEFEHLKGLKTGRRKRLDAFRKQLGTLKFLDPACGCGNFLIIAYRELRKLELEILTELKGSQYTIDLYGASLSVIDVDQFYGIELEEFPARIAEVAMWMIDHIMNREFSSAFGLIFNRIPLKKSPHIANEDALLMDWNELLPAKDCSYVLGNPPFAGKKEQSKKQKAQVRHIFEGVNSAGELDYVSCWYMLAVKYLEGNLNAQFAFVSTNSITQGEQVKPLWSSLLRSKFSIEFAHRTFDWTSEARGAAHVHVVIIGMANFEKNKRKIYQYQTAKSEPDVCEVTKINPYLIEWENTFVTKARNPISDRPLVRKGNEATDWGGLVLTQEEANYFRNKNDFPKKWIRCFWGGDEFINGLSRYCFWLKDANPRQIANFPELVARIKFVAKKRVESTKPRTIELANYPTLFGEIRQPDQPYILIPKVSSERREYIPIGIVSPSIIVSGSAQFIIPAQLETLGIVMSTMHMAWMRTTGGRTKSDYQYTNSLVYNTFPWPEVNDKQREKISDLAQAVLDARDQFPDATLADLYDPDLMPPQLRKAHTALDKAVDKLYRKNAFESERERVEHLFMLYEKMIAPIEAEAKKKPKRRKNT